MNCSTFHHKLFNCSTFHHKLFNCSTFRDELLNSSSRNVEHFETFKICNLRKGGTLCISIYFVKQNDGDLYSGFYSGSN